MGLNSVHLLNDLELLIQFFLVFLNVAGRRQARDALRRCIYSVGDSIDVFPPRGQLHLLLFPFGQDGVGVFWFHLDFQPLTLAILQYQFLKPEATVQSKVVDRVGKLFLDGAYVFFTVLEARSPKRFRPRGLLCCCCCCLFPSRLATTD